MISNLERAFGGFLDKAEQQGYDLGVEQGLLRAARGMLEKGIDVATVVEATGLSVDVVEKLRKSE